MKILSRMKRACLLGTMFLITGVLLEVADVGPAGPLGASTAQAIIGRPLTPMSYAGVARRTVRRTTYATSAAVGAATAATAATYATAATVASLPGHCGRTYVGGVTYYNCSGTYYRPYYDGPNLVYVVQSPY